MDTDNKSQNNLGTGVGQNAPTGNTVGNNTPKQKRVVYNSGFSQNTPVPVVNSTQGETAKSSEVQGGVMDRTEQVSQGVGVSQGSQPMRASQVNQSVEGMDNVNQQVPQQATQNVTVGSTNPSQDQNVPNEKLQGALGGDSGGVLPPNPNPYNITTEEIGVLRKFNKKGLIKILMIFGAVVFLATLIFLAIKYKPLMNDQLIGKKGEIVWWGINLDDTDIKILIEEYENENPNVDITYIKQSKKDYRERLTNALASGKGPDIFEIHNSWPAMFTNDLSSLPDSVMSKEEYAQTFYPVIVKDLTIGKGIVAIPLEYDAIALFINEDIFVSSSMQVPKTWDQMRNVAKALTQKDGRGIMIQAGLAIGMTNNVDYWSEVVALMMFQNRVNLAHLDQQLARDALSYYLLFRKDKVWDAILPPSTVAFSNGRLAMFFAPTKSAFEILERNPDLRFRTVLLPQLAKDDLKQPDVSYATYWAHAVWEKSSDKQEAWKFLKHMSLKETLNKLNRNIRISSNLHTMSPRMESASYYVEDPILGSIAALVTKAKSWYLADKTYDGGTGINSQFNEIFRDVIEQGVKGNIQKALMGADAQVKGLLSKYGIGW